MSPKQVIQILRDDIDKVDRNIVNLIGERLSYAKILSNVKKNNNLPIEDTNREADVLDKVAQQSHLNPYITEDFIKNLFKQIMDFTKEIEKSDK